MPGLVELVELAEEVVEYLRAQRVETSHQPMLLILDGNLEIVRAQHVLSYHLI